MFEIKAADRIEVGRMTSIFALGSIKKLRKHTVLLQFQYGAQLGDASTKDIVQDRVSSDSFPTKGRRTRKVYI